MDGSDAFGPLAHQRLPGALRDLQHCASGFMRRSDCFVLKSYIFIIGRLPFSCMNVYSILPWVFHLSRRTCCVCWFFIVVVVISLKLLVLFIDVDDPQTRATALICLRWSRDVVYSDILMLV